MKAKERWAEEYADRPYSYYPIDVEPLREEAWLAGFEFAKKEIMEKYSNTFEPGELDWIGEEEV